MRGIAGRIHVITGGAQGIGCATARVLAQNGGRVVVTDLASSDGERTARQIAAETRGDVRFMSLDVTDSAAVDALAARIEREVGPVHGLVANAGIHKTALAVEFSDEDWRRIIHVNLDGVFYCCRAFGNLLRGRGGSIAFGLLDRGNQCGPARNLRRLWCGEGWCRAYGGAVGRRVGQGRHPCKRRRARLYRNADGH